jgi:hypothetical protein
MLSAVYVKRVKGKGKKEVESTITNSLQGIHDYFTAPNIRNKARSLLFYLFMFCKCLAIYIDKPNAESLNVARPLTSEEEAYSVYTRGYKGSAWQQAVLTALGRELHRNIQLYQSGVPSAQNAVL